ncbi:MAG: zinc ABC transporter substrate-binding protein, partial [Myxococcota bacterium]
MAFDSILRRLPRAALAAAAMHAFRVLVVLASVGGALVSPAHAGLRVVATTPDLAAIAREVVGANATVVSLSLPTQDPHFVDPRPNLALELSKADALLLVGLELEVGWLPNLLTGARNVKIQPGAPGYIDCSAYPALLEVPTAAISRSMGDIHPGGNPHYTWDPRAARAIAVGLGARFGQLDAANAASYKANADAFTQRLDASLGKWAAEATALKGAPVIPFHRSLPYLSNWLGLSIAVEIEPKPGIPPTPAHVASVI